MNRCCAKQLIPMLQRSEYVLPPQLVHDLAEVVGNEAVVLGERVWTNFGNLPASDIGVQPVDKCLNLKEIRKWLEQMIIFLVGQIRLNVDIADKNNRCEGEDLLFPPTEL